MEYLAYFDQPAHIICYGLLAWNRVKDLNINQPILHLRYIYNTYIILYIKIWFGFEKKKTNKHKFSSQR